MTISINDIKQLDQPWHKGKVEMLINGETMAVVTDATGRQYDEPHTGRSAYDQRSAALDNGNVDDILEPLQLDIAIRTIRDPHVRNAMLLRTRGFGFNGDDYELSRAVGSHKSDRHLIERGIELVRRNERGRSVERSGNRVGSAVCWKCMDRPAMPGELCESNCDGKSDKLRRQLSGLKRGPVGNSNEPYNPLHVSDPCLMTEAEIEAEIAHLAGTQGVSDADARGVDRRKRDAPIAGGTEYGKRVVAYGLNPEEDMGDDFDWNPIP